VGVLDPNTGEVALNASILLVEDDHGDAVLVRACLLEVGIADDSIIWARNLGEALTVVAATKPVCILLDLGLPDAEGYSAVDKMVAAAPDIAVIVLTGRQERNGLEALGAGAQDYLVKDTITGDLLERSIRYARERKRAQRAQQQLREVRLSAAEQARLERGLLPKPLLLTDAVACATYYRPGRDDAVLGGDFFDVVETADGRIRAVIGDVMGHGPDEAALGVHLRVAWRTLLLAGVPDDRILPTLALLLGAEEDGHRRFVTVCDVTIAAGEMTVRVAGHPAPVLCAGDTPRYLDLLVGPPLGVQLPPGLVGGWPDNRVPMPAASSVLLYTDGLLEAYSIDATSDSLGISELVAGVRACTRSGEPAASWISSLVGNAPRESVDDTAAVVLTTRPFG
jgi:serine phosphatase RsbU (regulator of sigma subunit)